MIEHQQEIILQRLNYLIQDMKQSKDELHVRKMIDLMKKWHRQEFAIAFCGHFSAGKSSMLNELFGENLLPTSPIPTSANVVQITHGIDQVTLVLTSGEQHTFQGAYSDQELKELCKNGEEVIAVRLSRSTLDLPQGVSLLDTPGVDSTDDAHRLATESALHLADVIVFMMDYNHVQSEGNLQFLKELSDRSKQIYIVINQIDKHRAEEIEFKQYKQSVKEALDNWELKIAGVFYTTLREREHPENELLRLKEEIISWINQRRVFGKCAVLAEANYLLSQHMEWFREQTAEERDLLTHGLQDAGVKGEDIKEKIIKLDEQQKALSQRLNEAHEDFLRGIEEVNKNAYLMPADTRELAKTFLEGMQPDFKVGFFFSKGKTEQEKERRQEAFYEKLKQTVDTQLELHLRNYLIQYAKSYDIFHEEFGQQIFASKIDWNVDLLLSLIKVGSKMSGNTVLNYTEDLANEIKRLARVWAMGWEEEVFQPLLKKQIHESQEKLTEQEQQIKKLDQSWQRLNELEAIAVRYEQQLQERLQGNVVEQLDIDLEWLNRSNESETPGLGSTVSLWKKLTQKVKVPIKKDNSLSEPVLSHSKQLPKNENLTERNQRLLREVEEAEKALQTIRGVKGILRAITDKRERAEQKQFTIALFGAFSAGKSSFANALIGNAILPVSPNPMTATINKICPPNAEYAHGQVLLKLKSAEILFTELSQIYRLFEREVNSLDEAIRGIPKLLKQKNLTPQQKTLLPFLQALQEGMPQFGDLLGSEKVISLQEMDQYVANEKKSCFIEYANLYYDCPLTQQGITLVDTPGADSIHARHTGVAFEYIRNADVVLFVTYYNHAFSKADREFLIQLGRVKDSFAMDKMFFITNAADLASSQDELEGVQSYFTQQLLTFGIREPRMFAVSSLWGLAEKQGKPFEYGSQTVLDGSGFHLFEQAFREFLHRNLMDISLHSIQYELSRVVHTIEQMIVDAQKDKEQKKTRQLELQQELINVHATITSYQTATDLQALAQEIHELLYYVKQRWLLRYWDEFVEVFNPGSLREDRGNIKGQLHACVLEMVQFLKFDLLQEFRATGLRIDNWMRKHLDTHTKQLGKQIQSYSAGYEWHTDVTVGFELPKIAEPLVHLEVKDFKKSMSYFRNTKSFFVQNERAKMRDAMKEQLEEMIAPELTQVERQFLDYFQEAWKKELRRIQEVAMKQTSEYYHELQQVLMEEIDLAHYKQTCNQVSIVLEEMRNSLS